MIVIQFTKLYGCNTSDADALIFCFILFTIFLNRKASLALDLWQILGSQLLLAYFTWFPNFLKVWVDL